MPNLGIYNVNIRVVYIKRILRMSLRIGATIICSLLIVQIINNTHIDIAYGNFNYWGIEPALKSLFNSEAKIDQTLAGKLNEELKSTKAKLKLAKAKLKTTKVELSSIKIENSKLLAEKSTKQVTENSEQNINKNSLIKDILKFTESPSIVQVYDRSNELQLCDDKSRNKLEAWLYFYIAYGKFRPELAVENHSNLLKQIISSFSFIDELTPKQFSYLRSMMTDLRDYHSKIVNTDNWKSTFESTPKNGGYRNKETMDIIYSNGFSRTENECFNSSLELGINSLDNHGYFGIPYESWLYTFWLRRFNEGLFDETAMVLNTLDYMLRDKPEEVSKSLFYWSERNDTGKSESSELLHDLYGRYLIARKNQDKLFIWLEEDSENLKDIKLYNAFSLDGQYSFGPKKEAKLMDETSSSHVYELTDNVASAERITFLSTDPSVKLNNPFTSRKLESDENEEVLNLFSAIHELDWKPKRYNGDSVPCNQNPTIKKFSNGNKDTFLLLKQCNWYSGEGTRGPSIVAIISRNIDHSLTINFSYLKLSGSTVIKEYFMADEDNDGNLEVLLEDIDGLDNREILVELNENSWTVIREVSRYSEGGHERYFERESNYSLLNPM